MMEYGRYRIVKELGKGNMGVVYQAHDPKIDRMIALKVLRPDRMTSEAFTARFLKEARAIGRLTHPNIVMIYDVGEDRGTIYIAMEYLEGQPLDEVIKKGNLTVSQSIDLVCQVAKTLDYAHKQGIVHRDIKPSNILLTPDLKVKLTDFGIARIEDTSAGCQTQAGEILGTPIYMSPEQVMGKKADGRSDLYSLGVILYEMIAGKRPFSGSNLAAIFKSITNDAPETPFSIDPFISRSLSDLVMKSLHKSPDKRFQTGIKMSSELDTVNSQSRQPRAQAGKGKKKTGALMAIVAIVIVLAGLAGGGYYLYKNFIHQTDKNGEQGSITPAGDLVNLQLSSQPAGAKVYIDGIFKGETPLDLEMPTGKYEVRLSLTGYMGWEAQLDLDSPGPLPLEIPLSQAVK